MNNNVHVHSTLTYPGFLGTRRHSASRLFSLFVLHHRHDGFHPMKSNNREVTMTWDIDDDQTPYSTRQLKYCTIHHYVSFPPFIHLITTCYERVYVYKNLSSTHDTHRRHPSAVRLLCTGSMLSKTGVSIGNYNTNKHTQTITPVRFWYNSV